MQEKDVGRSGVTYLLELRDEQLWMHTGSRPQDEVTEVYASAAEAAHFVRDRWREM
jgi:hypothetical protein